MRAYCVLRLLPVLALLTAPASAQVVRGTVLGAAEGEGIDGAVVRLIDADSLQVAMVLTDRQGRFVAVAPRSGTYVLEVQHVAFVTVRTRPFTVPETGATTQNVPLDARPDPATRAPPGRRADDKRPATGTAG